VIADRVSADLDTVTDFYSGPMSQVYASRWSKGRFVMLGDAAYCPTPFTGAGTALALVGAYVLAGELARSADHVQAFETYERSLRPYVERAQARLSPRTIQLLHPKSAAGAFLARLALQICASRLMQKLFRPSAAKRAKDIADDFVFPDYDRRPAADA
jgi:2-polyprenyl-6-methoxyphenol hydroxylase-like FAD-dependent oxidoreductase